MILNNGINTRAMSNPFETETEKTSRRPEADRTGYAQAATVLRHAQQVALSSTTQSL